MIDNAIINKIKQINLISFLEKEGYSFKKEGVNIYRCIEKSSLVVSQKGEKQLYYWNSENQKGDIITFVKENLTNNNFPEAIEYLLKYNDRNNNSLIQIAGAKKIKNINENKELKELGILYNKDMKRMFAYLCKSRGISYEIVGFLVKEGLLREDIKNNIVFAHINEVKQIVGADLNGTNTYIRFKGVAKNSNPNYGFSLNIGNNPKKIYIFEAPIDLISFYQIYKRELKNTVLLSLGGCEKINIINTYLNIYGEIDTINVATDNDLAGNNCYNNIKETYNTINVIDERQSLKDAGVKDYNELLLLRK